MIPARGLPEKQTDAYRAPPYYYRCRAAGSPCPLRKLPLSFLTKRKNIYRLPAGTLADRIAGIFGNPTARASACRGIDKPVHSKGLLIDPNGQEKTGGGFLKQFCLSTAGLSCTASQLHYPKRVFGLDRREMVSLFCARTTSSSPAKLM